MPAPVHVTLGALPAAFHRRAALLAFTVGTRCIRWRAQPVLPVVGRTHDSTTSAMHLRPGQRPRAEPQLAVAIGAEGGESESPVRTIDASADRVVVVRHVANNNPTNLTDPLGLRPDDGDVSYGSSLKCCHSEKSLLEELFDGKPSRNGLDCPPMGDIVVASPTQPGQAAGSLSSALQLLGDALAASLGRAAGSTMTRHASFARTLPT